MMSDRQKPFLLARAPTMAALLVAWFGLAGCSSVPDAVNPVEWYRGAAGWFESDDDQAQRDQAKTAAETAPPLPGTNRDYPNLSTVPERPRSVSTPEERNRVSSGLAADRENARYAKPEPGRPLGAMLGAPEAAPRTPVVTDPSGPSPETLEALPLDSVPVTPVPRSSREEAAPAASVAAVPAPAEPPPTPAVKASPAPPAVQASMPSTPPAVQASTPPAPMAPTPGVSLVEQTYKAAIAQQAAAAIPDYGAMPSANPSVITVASPSSMSGAMPGAMPDDGTKTVAGTLIPGSFVVHFRGGSTEIRAPDQALLRDVAQLYKSTNGHLRIVGHTSSNTRESDAINHRIVNLRISIERAEAVARELARLGVPRANMTIVGMSDNEPLYQETTQAGIAGNRRVEIFFGS